MQWESFQYEILRAVLSHACLTQETGSTKMTTFEPLKEEFKILV